MFFKAEDFYLTANNGHRYISDQAEIFAGLANAKIAPLVAELTQVKSQVAVEKGMVRFWKKDSEIKQAELTALKAKLEVCLAGLAEIKLKDGMTLLGECCVDRTCKPTFDPPSACTHNYGVARGFSQCAAT